MRSPVTSRGADRDPGALALPQKAEPGADRRPAGERGFLILGEQLEFEPDGAADQPLQRLGILDPRDLHDDPVGALQDDRRLERAGQVDPPVDHVAGIAHRILDRLLDPGLGLTHHEPVAAFDADLPVGRLGEADRLRLVAREPRGFAGLGGVADRKAQQSALGGKAADLDAGAAHLGPDQIFHRFEPLAGDIVGLRLEQQMAAAGEIEAEIDVDRLRPGRQPGLGPRRKQARQPQQHAGRADQADPPNLPAREEHLSRSPPWRHADERRSAAT